jgi:CRISPR-associated protein Cmr2
MPDAVLRFTFGPVQAFIAEARRTADLYAGSHILAELARAAARSLQDAGAELVYPADLGSGDPPNVIVARVPWEDAESLAERAAAALQARWEQLASDALAKLESYAPLDDALRAQWRAQTGDVWEIYWAAARIEQDDYATAFHRAQAGIAALKKTRTFTQRAEAGAKDSLGGNRAALAPAGQDPRDFWRAVRRHPQGGRLVGEHERLDAVSAVKRFAYSEEAYPSVPTIAARPFARLAAERAAPALESYRDAFELLVTAFGQRPDRYRRTRHTVEAFPYDGAFLYESTLEWPALVEELGLDPDEAERLRSQVETPLRTARHRLAELYQAVGQRPSRYVAVVVLDGDSMGQWLTSALGEGGLEAHREISRKLARFAVAAAAVAEHAAPDAVLVYQGGDDVVALAPAEQAVPLALALAAAFAEITDGRSASAGIAIGHWLEPLGDLLRSAREAEKRAKRLPGKGAVAVELQPRGGEIVHVVARADRLVGLDLPDLVDRFRRDGAGSLSGRLPTDLRQYARAFPQADAAFRAVLARSVKRQGEWPSGTADERERLVERLYGFATSYDQLRASLPGEDDSRRFERVPSGPAQLADWLALARFLARGGGE